MNPAHLVWLLPLVAALAARATVDVVRWRRARQVERMLDDLRRMIAVDRMQLVERHPHAIHHPVIAHDFVAWEKELKQ